MGTIESFVLAIVAAIILFLLFRAIMLWYWKIDVMLTGMDKMHEELVRIRKQLEPEEKDLIQ